MIKAYGKLMLFLVLLTAASVLLMNGQVVKYQVTPWEARNSTNAGRRDDMKLDMVDKSDMRTQTIQQDTRIRSSLSSNDKDDEKVSITDPEIPSARKDRFPSAEERVKVYMSNWFLPPCSDEDKVVYSINATHLSLTTPDGKITIDYPNIYTVDKVGALTKQEQLNSCAKGPCHKLQGITRALCGYCVDIPFQVENKPFLFSFGDEIPRPWLPKDDQTTFPHIRKVRYGTTRESLRKATESQRGCLTWEERTPLRLKDHPKSIMSPIIWLLTVQRHYSMLPDVPKNDIKWEEKMNAAVFRGSLTGLRNEGFRPGLNISDYEKCMMIPKCRLVYRTAKISGVDAKIVDDGLFQHIPRIIEGVNLTGDGLSMKDQLKYKCVIMLEGNDISTGLKWALYSNSVVLMPPPTRMSWAMEDLLEPFVHYVPLDPSFNDTVDKLQWVIDHDEEARRIAKRGQLWISDMSRHPDSTKDDEFIQEELVRRYLSLFRERIN